MRRLVLAATPFALLLFLVALGPFLAPYDPMASDYALSLAAPCEGHPFGCDFMGRDVLSRVIVAARGTVLTALAATAIPLVIGTAVGLAAACAGGWVDALLMRVADVFQAFPEIVLAVAIAGILGPGPLNAAIAVVAVTWVRHARTVRALALELREADFVTTARLSGEGPVSIAVRHLLPNMGTQVVTMGVADLGFVMLSLAGLSFLGLGAQPPLPEWGLMLSEGRSYFLAAPHLMFFPGLAVLLAVASVNLLGSIVGEGIRGQGRSQKGDNDVRNR